MKTVEDIVHQANSLGLNVNNLFQLRDLAGNITGWQANFHHKSGWYDYGRGASMVEALEDAFSRARGLQGAENRPIPRDAPAKAAVEELML